MVPVTLPYCIPSTLRSPSDRAKRGGSFDVIDSAYQTTKTQHHQSTRQAGEPQRIYAGPDDFGTPISPLVDRRPKCRRFVRADRRRDIADEFVSRAPFVAHARVWPWQFVSHGRAQ